MRIAIIGAGIGGLSLAAALARRGVECSVYEQAHELSEVGAGLQLAPSSARLLYRLGLRDRLDARAIRIEALQLRRWQDDRLLASTTMGEACEQLYGAPYYTVHRADLQQGLLALLNAVNIELGHRLCEVAEGAGEVALTFENGVRTFADVVVGADGIHSIVRDSIAQAPTVFSGRHIYRGLVPAELVPELAAQRRVTVWLGPGQHCVCYPVSAGSMFSFAATCPTQHAGSESWSENGDPRELAASYLGWNQQVTELISAAATVRRWALHDRGTLARWSTRRLTVLGDAAHPMLPFLAQGANQAIEDAFVLAGCLAGGTAEQLPTALTRYEQLRAPRTSAIQSRSRANDLALHLADGDEQRARDTSMAGSSLTDYAWLYGYDADLAVRGPKLQVALQRGDPGGVVPVASI